MNMLRSVFVLSLIVCLAPIALLAQDPPPPPRCCPRSADVPPDGDGGVVLSRTPVQSDLVVSLQMLDAQQITRAQFIDRLSVSLFPGESVDVILASRSGPMLQAGGSEEDGLLAIQETRVYRFPRQRISAQRLEQLREVYIASGELYVKVTFVDTSSYDSELAPSAAIHP